MISIPPPLRWLWNAWLAFAHAFGKVMSTILLTIIWVVGFGIYGVIFKILRLFRREHAIRSYWILAEPSTAESYRRQF